MLVVRPELGFNGSCKLSRSRPESMSGSTIGNVRVIKGCGSSRPLLDGGVFFLEQHVVFFARDVLSQILGRD